MDLPQTIETKIRAEARSRFTKLALPGEFVAPNYHGRSIVNVSISIARLLGAKTIGLPLDAEILDGLDTDVRRIVLVIVDALGYSLLLKAMNEDASNGFHSLLQRGARILPLTSVFPSTTTAALTALWTACTPAEHGFMGYQLFLREFGSSANMIGFSPIATEQLGNEQLLHAGLEPERFLPVPSLPQILASVRVPVYSLIEQPYLKSALSRVQIRGAKTSRGFVTSSDMWVVLSDLLEQSPRSRALFVAYWSAVDTISHIYGPDSEANIAEINNFAFSFQREFLKGLRSSARKGTLFLLTADHGQLSTPISHTIHIQQHPDLIANLTMPFTGEPRAAYLYCRQGRVEAVREYLDHNFRDRLVVLDSSKALRAGLFGSGKFASETDYRVGDLFVIPRNKYILWDKTEEPKLKGRHGGMTEQEMLVPLLAARLDA